MILLQGGMMTSPSGALGAQFNMGRMPSMGLGNLDSMELPDTVRLRRAEHPVRPPPLMLPHHKLWRASLCQQSLPHVPRTCGTRSPLRFSARRHSLCWRRLMWVLCLRYQAGPLDANAAAAMLHDMPAHAGSTSGAPGGSAAPPAGAAQKAASAGGGDDDGARNSDKGENNSASDMQARLRLAISGGLLRLGAATPDDGIRTASEECVSGLLCLILHVASLCHRAEGERARGWRVVHWRSLQRTRWLIRPRRLPQCREGAQPRWRR